MFPMPGIFEQISYLQTLTLALVGIVSVFILAGPTWKDKTSDEEHWSKHYNENDDGSNPIAKIIIPPTAFVARKELGFTHSMWNKFSDMYTAGRGDGGDPKGISFPADSGTDDAEKLHNTESKTHRLKDHDKDRDRDGNRNRNKGRHHCRQDKSSSADRVESLSIYSRGLKGTFHLNHIPSGSTPVLAFVNSKSGGRKGEEVLSQLKNYLNPSCQVVDLAHTSPETVITAELLAIPRLILLVCGGDGTVTWILNTVDKAVAAAAAAVTAECSHHHHDLVRKEAVGSATTTTTSAYTCSSTSTSSNETPAESPVGVKDMRTQTVTVPPIAIYPLGTGNDLSHVLGWGASVCLTSPTDSLLSSMESSVSEFLDSQCSDIPHLLMKIAACGDCEHEYEHQSRRCGSSFTDTSTDLAGGDDDLGDDLGGESGVFPAPEEEDFESGGDMIITGSYRETNDVDDEAFNSNSNIGASVVVRVAELDRWRIDLTPPIGADSTVQLSAFSRKQHNILFFNNYFSVGVDAQIVYNFHDLRTQSPQHFVSQLGNKLWYGVVGGAQVLSHDCQGLPRVLALFVNDVRVDLPPDLEGVIFSNIGSYAGGTHLWQVSDAGAVGAAGAESEVGGEGGESLGDADANVETETAEQLWMESAAAASLSTLSALEAVGTQVLEEMEEFSQLNAAYDDMNSADSRCCSPNAVFSASDIYKCSSSSGCSSDDSRSQLRSRGTDNPLDDSPPPLPVSPPAPGTHRGNTDMTDNTTAAATTTTPATSAATHPIDAIGVCGVNTVQEVPRQRQQRQQRVLETRPRWFRPDSMCDGVIEVLGVSGSLHLAQIKAGLALPIRLAQIDCNQNQNQNHHKNCTDKGACIAGAKSETGIGWEEGNIETFNAASDADADANADAVGDADNTGGNRIQIRLVTSRALPMQMDGEPWLEEPCDLTLTLTPRKAKVLLCVPQS